MTDMEMPHVRGIKEALAEYDAAIKITEDILRRDFHMLGGETDD